MNKLWKIGLSVLGMALIGCSQPSTSEVDQSAAGQITVEAENFDNSSGGIEGGTESVELKAGEWLSLEVEIPRAGRYSISVYGKSDSAVIWLEDYINNPDGRTYDISGKLLLAEGNDYTEVIGSPLDTGTHAFKIHLQKGIAEIDKVVFELIRTHKSTPETHVQNMEGTQWELVWSDEFDGQGLPDSSKWNYNIGNWGWGNNELQYYTENRTENARQENGHLIIEARKNDDGHRWTSARLTTQGEHAFLYGRIEFRAKVPTGRGAWAAGWLLGDSYRDEISWPYCGEIDVLECVGYEIDDSTGTGKNHATCHTRAYYFKQNNQIGSEIAVDSMHTKFHTYAIEWYEDRILGFLDGEHYYTYDKNQNELEWPFDKPQNIIVNIAVGGVWGGREGIDPSWDSHQYILDYIRVYEKKKS